MAQGYRQRVGAGKAPFTGGVAVTKSDVTILPITRGLYVGGGGDIQVRFADGTDQVVLKAVPTGTTLDIAIDMVYSANTTATLMTALY